MYFEAIADHEARQSNRVRVDSPQRNAMATSMVGTKRFVLKGLLNVGSSADGSWFNARSSKCIATCLRSPPNSQATINTPCRARCFSVAVFRSKHRQSLGQSALRSSSAHRRLSKKVLVEVSQGGSQGLSSNRCSRKRSWIPSKLAS